MPEVTPICQFGKTAFPFKLTGTDDKEYSLEDLKARNGILIMFICNHCPYVKGVINRLTQDVIEIQEKGIACVAIMSNDTDKYPEDSFENMKIFANKNKFTFPYLIDRTQEIAKKYNAVCTPDFFGFNNKLELQYRGRLDDSGISGKPVNKRELLEAMIQISKTGLGPKKQIASMGCSIKWRENV